MTTLELLKEFLKAFFVEHNQEKAVALVTDDIHGYGFMDNMKIGNMEDIKKLVVSEKYYKCIRFHLQIEESEQIFDDSAVLRYSLSCNSVSIQSRIVANSRQTSEGNRLYLIHNTILDSLQMRHTFDDIARLKRNEHAREVLKESFPGGLMGGYMERGFPFYFINDTMLQYLGYESEDEFIGNTQGLIENCIYADDRETVDKAVDEQISATGKYEINYRMLKKDGSYIWVHDVGKKIVAEDGRDAIVSACYDITERKEHDHFLEGIVAGLNGYLALLAVDLEHRKTIPIYVSGHMGKHEKLTNKEYLARYYSNGMDFIFDGDKERVWNAICDAVSGDALPSISIRALDRQGKAHWVNASFAKHSTHDGLPAVLTLFTASTMQNDLRLHALSQNGTGISVIDAGTHEVYFANDAMFRMLGSEPFDYTNKLCPEILSACGGSCESCGMHDVQEQEVLDKTSEINGRWLSLHAERRRWADKSVVSIYATDVTQQHILAQELEKEDAQLQGILENIACGICIVEFDKTGNATITYTSDVLAKMSESDTTAISDEFKKEPFHSVAREDVSLLKKILTQLVANGGSDEITYRFKTFHGKNIWIRSDLTALKKPDGGCTMYITCIDVTEKMQQQELLKDMFSNLPGGVCLYRWDGETLQPISISRHYSDFYGIDTYEMMQNAQGVNYNFVHPNDLPGLQDYIKKCAEKPGEGYTYIHRVWNTKKQRYLWICATANVVAQENGNLFYVNYTDVTEIKELESSLRQEQALLRTACDSAALWTWVYYISQDQIRASQRLQDDFGLPKYFENYSTVWSSMQLVQPESAELYRQKILEIRNGGSFAQFEAKVKNKRGEEHWYRIRFQRLTDNPDVAVCIGQIIDDEKVMQARVELEINRTMSSDNNMMGYVISNLTKNKIVERGRKWSEERLSVIGQPIEQSVEEALPYINEANREEYRTLHDRNMLLDAYRRGKTVLEFVGIRMAEDGTSRWMRSSLNLVKNPANDDIYLYEYLYDIHAQKMLEEMMNTVAKFDYERVVDINLQADQMTTILSDADDCPQNIFVRNYTSGMKEYVNTTIVQSERKAMLAKFTLERIMTELADKDSYEFIHHVIEKDGSIGCRRTRFSYYNRNMGICLMTTTDITNAMKQEEARTEQLSAALKQARDALAIANAASQTKSEFLSRMSHEIRTPMNAIMGMTAIAQDNKTDYLQVSDCLAKIDFSSKYLLTLINDILEMSRIESGKTKLSEEKFDFAALIDGIRTVAEPLARKSEVRLEISNRTANGSYYGDRIRIQQVMINLLGNALKFTKKSGRVRFAASTVEDTDTQTIFEFLVEDTGIGMSEEFMKTMFEPFSQEDSTTTSRYGGSGLGLAISKGLVEAMGGTIEAESMVGIGTNFTVRIPLAKAQSAMLLQTEKTDAMKEVEIDAILKGKSILMAEDHPMNVMVAKRLLERKGILLTIAENGKIAVDIFCASSPDEYDAILMDIRMPIMDGLEATRQIRALDRPDAKVVPIIAMTANALEEDRKNSKAAGMNEHLAKPIEPKKLYQTLATQIARRTI